MSDQVNGFQVNIASGSEQQVVNYVEAGLRLIPEPINTDLAAAGANIVDIGVDAQQLAPSLYNQPVPASGGMAATIQEADGFTNPITGAIDIPSFVSGSAIVGNSKASGEVINFNAEATTIHEVGHEFDYLAGSDGNPLSSTSLFESLLFQDLHGNSYSDPQFAAQNAAAISRYANADTATPEGADARAELEADIFTAILLGTSGNGLPLSYYQDQYPQLVSLVAGQMLTDHSPDNLKNISPTVHPNITTALSQAIGLASNAYKNEGYDPLIVSLGNGGVQLTSLQNGTQFDLQDTGFAQQTAWLANSNEGFLVVDPNNDAITNGSQLLGQNTVLPNGTVASSGFQALDELSDAQTQQSGILTDSDPLFDELRIYENNGTLLTLQQAGITAINLSAENTDVTDQYGNQQLDIGTFTFANGTTGFMGDYALVHNTQLSTDESTLPVSATVAALPNVPGSGVVPSLQQAMMQDTSGNLESLVEQFIASTDPTSQSSILDQIMTAWAGAPNSDVQPDEHVTVVENLMGETFTNAGPAVTGNSLGIAVEGAYQLFKESTWAQLMVQSQLSSLFSQITTSVDPDTGITTYDFSGLIQSLQNELQSNYTQGVQDLANSYRAIVDLGMDQNSNFATFYSAFSSNSTLKFAMDTAGKEAYFSATGFTGSIDNTITPNLYIDLTANDYSGPVFAGIDDVIFFDKNNGPVSLEEGNDETIVLGSDVSSNDVYFTSNDDVEVVMHFFDSNATLTLGAGVTDYGWTNQSASQQITAIQFVDGTQITGNDLLNDISAYANQNQDLNRVGITINETDYASGSDSVYAGSGQDTVVGGTGTESLYAGSGQDTLIAGTGNTTMYGGAGTDTFVFGPGNGVASIIEPTTSSAKSDLLEVNDTLTDTTFTESGNNLILTLASGDQIMLQNELTQQDVQEFSFSDGNVLALSDIESGLVTLNAPSGQSTFIAPDNSYIIQGTGNETIFTKDGNDTVYGNGNSTINLGAGTDTVDAGPGVSTISGGDGNAAIIFNQGDGQQTLSLNGGNNLISFGSGITASDLQFSAEGTALAIGFANSNDEILVTSQFANASVNTFNFSDGSQLTWQSALQGIEIAGTAPGDTINDTLSTANDIIQGARGNETILLGAGNDTVITGNRPIGGCSIYRCVRTLSRVICPLFRTGLAALVCLALIAFDAQATSLSIRVNSHGEADLSTRTIEPAELFQLAHLSRLRSLNLQSSTVKDSDLAIVGQLCQLRKLNLSLTGISDNGVAHLTNLVNLESLGLADTKITDEGLRYLANLKNLEVLGLASTRIAGEGLKYLINLDKLRRLILRGARLSDAGARQLSKLTQLTDLELPFCNISDIAIEPIGKLISLNRLNISENRQLTNKCLHYLSSLVKLQVLDLPSGSMSPDGLDELRDLKELAVIRVDMTNNTDAWLHHLRYFSRLKYLWLSGTDVSDSGLSSIQYLPKLQVIDLDRTSISDDGLLKLPVLAYLKELVLSRTHITDRCLMVVSKLPSIESLNLAGTQISDAGLKELVAARTLKILDLDRSNVHGPGISYLSSLPHLLDLSLSKVPTSDRDAKSILDLRNLEDLNLSRTDITDTLGEQLHLLSHLKGLNLAETNVTDRTVKQLHFLSHLKELNLSSTKITDKSINELAQFKNLEHLYVYNTALTHEDAAKLARSLPRCVIFM